MPLPQWPAAYPAAGNQFPTGWLAAPGSSKSLNVPDDWTSGRIWGRLGCDGTGSNCASGGCPGGLECTAWGVLPATLAEFGLGSWNGLDFYDISLSTLR